MINNAIYANQRKWISQLCLAFLISLLPLVLIVTVSRSAGSDQRQQPDELHQLWSTFIDSGLRQNVTAGQAENVGVIWMVPLHAAFHRRDEVWEHTFADHFSRVSPQSF